MKIRHISYMIAITLLLSCDKETVLVCAEFGYYNGLPNSEEHYMTGVLNGKDWVATHTGWGPENEATRSKFGLFGKNANRCSIEKGSLSYSPSIIPDIPSRIDNPVDIRYYFNYGDAYEILTTSPYDSLVVSNDFENYIEITHMSADSSILEGKFQVHLMKKGNFPSQFGEPPAIIIQDGRFRLGRP